MTPSGSTLIHCSANEEGKRTPKSSTCVTRNQQHVALAIMIATEPRGPQAHAQFLHLGKASITNLIPRFGSGNEAVFIPSVMADCDGISIAFSFKLCTYLI